MSLSVAFYKALSHASGALGEAFHFASGGAALERRNLKRGDDVATIHVTENILCALGTCSGVVTAVTTGAMLAPFSAPIIALAVIFAATMEAVFLPAQLDALYRAGRHDFKAQQNLPKA